MKIQSVKYWKQDLELKRPYSISYKTVDSVVSAFVEITLENGLTGIGAANPSPYVVGEDVEAAMKVLETDAMDFLVGKDIRSTHLLLEELVQKFPNNPGVRATADIALYDVFTKYLDVPLVTYLGQHVEKMATSVTIGIKNVEETLENAEEFVGDGFRILKVKLGNDLEEDIERLIKLREKYGYNLKIRIDSNQGYSVDQFKEFFRRTQDLDIELNEQPLKADMIQEMKDLPDEIKDTVAADETLVGPLEAFVLAAPPRAAGIFNIKLMKTGGIHQALKIARIAETADIDLMWGCNDESQVSIAAALHAAFSSPNTKYIDLDGSLDLAKDAVTGGFIIEDGYMKPNGKPGLGVEKVS
jgi:L-alanine-DL-glutamate epimerase-like enolase superfamily enzyme